MSLKDTPYITADQIKVWREEGASHLTIEIEGMQSILGARIKRVFPLSSPDQFFSIQNAEDDEVVILKSLDGASEDARKLIEEELDRRYFSPVISKINHVKSVPGMWSFDVETNRGPIVFYVRNWRESSYEVETNRWHITSVDGERFEIKDLDALDKRSQKLIEQLL